jgi:NTP pyrophosphatase (non-canonical NTP hydrolase)
MENALNQIAGLIRTPWLGDEERMQKIKSAVDFGLSSEAPVPQSELLTFDAFRAANVTRCVKWHPAGIDSWSPSDWLTAVTGELGELASLLKMRNRERDGLPGNKFSPTDKQVADEIADVLTYLDLLAAALGVDLGLAAVSKFNEVSERVGFSDRIALSVAQTATPQGEPVADDWDPNPDGIKPGEERGPRMNPHTGIWED